MDAPESTEKRLETVYKFFSHHIRTNTAVIVGMLEAINEGLSDESMYEMIMEAGYLLDLFDRGMSVCFNHLFNKKESSEPERVELFKLVSHFVKNGVAKDGSRTTEVDIPENIRINCEPYSFKSLLQIFIHEADLAAESSFKLSFCDGSLEITPDREFYQNPPVFDIFRSVLSAQGIETEYNNKSIILRFPNESIDC